MVENYILIAILITTISGYLSGFFTVKINHLLIILTGKIWTSGHGQQRYLPIGAAISGIYIILLITIFLDFPVYGYLLLIIVFVGLYASGIKHGEKRFVESIEVMKKIIELTYVIDETNEEQIQAANDAKRFSVEILNSMPKSTSQSLLLLFFFFDSVFAVFFVSLLNGKFCLRRFINLSKNDQLFYIESWAYNSVLFVAIQAIKGLIGFSFYSGPKSWSEIGYNGEMLRRSYLG